MVPQVIETLAYRNSDAMQNDSRAVKILTFIAMLYLPAFLVAVC